MKQNLTHITLVLDSSASMGAIANDTIGGFNRFVAGQQRETNGQATLTLVLFNDTAQVHCARIPINAVAPLTPETDPTDGGTALLDAVGASIAATAREQDSLPEAERPDRVIFVILTDGQENASREFNRETVVEMIRQRQEQHGWQFIFLGANQDAIQEGGRIGIGAEHSVNFEASGAGVTAAFASASNLVQNYRGGVSPKAKPSSPNPTAAARAKLRRERRRQKPSKN